MSTNARPAAAAAAPGGAPSDPVVKAAAAWLNQLARTLKTCRLYDATNPTVVRFREELGGALLRLLGDHGAVTFRFEANDVLLDGVSLHPARSRDDNLAFAFYRDGVRGLTFQPGLAAAELEAVLDCVLAVTGQNLDEDDLVTLLWEANLAHVEVDYIPAEGGDADAAATGGDDAAPLLPWPTASEVTEAPAPAAGAADAGRSEDWTVGDLTVEVEATFVELDAIAPVEVERFRSEYGAEHAVAQTTAAIAIANACLAAGANDEDRREIARFLPRVLRAALAAGAWADGRDALRLVRSLASPDWSEETFAQELLQPVSVTRTVERLDGQDAPRLEDFLKLGLEVGDPGVDWLTLCLSESQQRSVRQRLAEAIADRCREHPERLAPWLADGRWYVVRNIVHILGWIGGAGIVPQLQVALRHPDARVHAAVVGALQNLDLRTARPLLVRALDGADTRLFTQILHQLSAARDPSIARYVFAYVQQERFLARPVDERRAIYAAVASTGGDELVPELEAELLKGNWFDRDQEIHRHAVARCLARIGTPRAIEALQRGAQSRRAPVRTASEIALASRTTP